MSKTENKKGNDKEKQQEVKKPVPVLQAIRTDIFVIEKAIENKDYFYVSKILKKARSYKKRLNSAQMNLIWSTLYSESLNFSNFPDSAENLGETFDIPKEKASKLIGIVEVEIFVRLLLTIHLVKHKSYVEAKVLIDKIVKTISECNKRHLDQVGAIVYFYYAHINEKLGTFKDIRGQLFDFYRNSCLKHDEIGQATLLNLLLRNYLESKNYEAALHLISKTNFPEGKAYNELIRYLYYTGKIKAIQLEYNDSFARLMQALRKAPETKAALGFRVACQKLAIVVELLIGEIPDRNIFSQVEYLSFLQPYYKLVQSVLHGNLSEFNSLVEKYKQVFVQDDLLNLIKRLHQNVIKTGLRRINISYSKISLADIALKLQLSSQEDVEFIVAKAIRDGVMNATIDYEARAVYLREKQDLYATNEPETAFKRRIDFCFNLHTSATKALQYPMTGNVTYEVEKIDYDPEELLKMAEEEGDDDF